MIGEKFIAERTGVLVHVEGGIYKRMDENRELRDFLQHHCSELLRSSPWIDTWLQSNDAFYEALIAVYPDSFLEDDAFRKNLRPKPAEWIKL